MAATLAAQRMADREALDRQLAHVEDQADAVTRAADLQQENCHLQQRLAVLEAELKGGGGVTTLQVLHTLPSKLTHCCWLTHCRGSMDCGNCGTNPVSDRLLLSARSSEQQGFCY